MGDGGSLNVVEIKNTAVRIDFLSLFLSKRVKNWNIVRLSRASTA